MEKILKNDFATLKFLIPDLMGLMSKKMTPKYKRIFVFDSSGVVSQPKLRILWIIPSHLVQMRQIQGIRLAQPTGMNCVVVNFIVSQGVNQNRQVSSIQEYEAQELGIRLLWDPDLR